MIKFLKNNAWAMYLGGILAVYDLPLTTAGFWIIFIPTALLVAWHKGFDKK